MDATQLSSGGSASDPRGGATAPRHHRRRGMLGAIALAALLVTTGPAAFGAQSREAGAAIAAAAPAAIPPGDAAYLPKSTVMFASVNPSIGGVQGTYLHELESIFKSEPGFGNLMKSITGAKNTNCIDINNQVLSWINGSITLAFTNASVFSSVASTLPISGTKSTSSPKTQGLAIVLAIKPSTVHSILAQHKLDALPGILKHYRLGTTTAEGFYQANRSSQRVNIYTLHLTACGMKPDTSPTYAAIVGNEGVVAPTKADLKQVIDVMQGKQPSLANTAAFQGLLTSLPPTGLGYFYLNTPALVQAGSGVAGSLGGTTGITGTASSVNTVAKDLGPFGAAIETRANGFSVASVQVINAAPKPVRTAVPPNTGETPNTGITPNLGATMLPQHTLFYMSIGDLQGVINGVLGALKAGASAQDAKTYDSLATTFSGVLTLLNGETVLGVLPMSAQDAGALAAGNIGGLPLAALFGLKTHDAATAAQQVVSGLLALASSGSGSQSATPQPSPTLTTLPNGGMEYATSAGYGYAVLGRWLVASTAIKTTVAKVQAVLSNPLHNTSLAADSVYQTAGSGLPKHATATAYLDITDVRTLLEGLLLGKASKADQAQYRKMQSLLLPLKALEAGTSSENKGKVLRTDLFLLIEK